MTTADILRQAAAIQAMRGWRRGTWGASDPTGPCCLEGAIAQAMGITPDTEFTSDNAAFEEFEMSEPVRLTLKAGVEIASAGYAPYSLWRFNDQTVRSTEHAVQILRAAAVRAEASDG